MSLTRSNWSGYDVYVTYRTTLTGKRESEEPLPGTNHKESEEGAPELTMVKGH